MWSRSINEKISNPACNEHEKFYTEVFFKKISISNLRN